MYLYGLVGYPLSHSFSEKYFQNKFQKENIPDTAYRLFPLKNISEFPDLLKKNQGLSGLNVTIPYKEEIIPYLDHIDETAKNIGAVNTIKFTRQENKGLPLLTGYNTDSYGFKKALKPFLRSNHEKALILGTGGGAKAVYNVLKQIGIECFFVSRTLPGRSSSSSFSNYLNYNEITKNVINACQLIVNTTPVGMFPNVNEFPAIPYEYITPNHFLFDLIYNPEETLFLKKGKEKGAITQNGLGMFYMQAEKSWEIWKEETLLGF